MRVNSKMKVYNYLIRTLLKNNIKKYAEKYLSGNLIDVGCGTKQYEEVVAPFVKNHIGVDYSETLHGTENVDIVASAYDVPVDNNSYDSVLCTEVIEHLHEEPRDFYRYSKYGLKYLAEKTGFEVVLIEPIGGFWITFGQLFVYWLHTYNKGIIRYTMIIPLVGVLVQLLSFGLNKLFFCPQWTSHYISVFRKPN